MKAITSLPEDLHEQVLLAMQPGEEPLWIAQPVPTLINRMSKPCFFFAGFALFLSTMFVVLGGLAGLPMLVVLTGIPLVMPWVIRRRMKRTAYLLTQRRAIVLRPVGRNSWQSVCWPLEPGLLKARELRADGSGDLIFGYEGGADGETSAVPMGFFNLPELRRVEQFILEITDFSQSVKSDSHDC